MAYEKLKALFAKFDAGWRPEALQPAEHLNRVRAHIEAYLDQIIGLNPNRAGKIAKAAARGDDALLDDLFHMALSAAAAEKPELFDLLRKALETEEQLAAKVAGAVPGGGVS